MRKFVCSPYGEEVDLDDPFTFNHLPDNANQLRDILFKEFGWSKLYMDFFYPDIFEAENDQRTRIEQFMKNYSENHKINYDNVMWLKEQVFLFQDEIENMC